MGMHLIWKDAGERMVSAEKSRARIGQWMSQIVLADELGTVQCHCVGDVEPQGFQMRIVPFVSLSDTVEISQARTYGGDCCDLGSLSSAWN